MGDRSVPQMRTTRKVVPLDKGWTFKQVDAGSDSDHENSAKCKEFLPVSQFPTNVHLDLMHHKIIPDPFIGKNENVVQWVGEKAWVYRTSFSSPLKQVENEGGEKVVLAFDGLDTYATVKLNGKEILKTENMFIPERMDVTAALKEKNNLEITFESTYLVGKKIVERHPEHQWGCWNGDCSRLVSSACNISLIRV